MKKLLYKIAFILSLWVTIQAQAQEQESRKTVQKSYSASGMNLKITNSYGKVHVNTNSGSQINVKIEIIAKASSKAKADEILERISIATTQSGNLIAFETTLSNISGWSWGGRTSFEINYTVDMPSTTPLEVYNKYGNTYLSDFSAKLMLQTSYGNIKTEKITGSEDKNIQSKYGNAQITYLEKGNIAIAYGNLTLDQANQAKVKVSYSNVSISKVNTLGLFNSYSNIEIDNVESIDGSSDYAGKFIIKNLGKSINMTGAYNGSFKIEGISRNCQNITIDTRYSDCSLDFNEDAGCQFELNLKYGSLVGDKDKFSFQSKVVENSSAYYQGKYGKNNNTKVQINAKYGNVKIK
ncbi:MAG: hypothetical protein MUC49_11440 [Raineya sp.]|jgi:hypothetical protein|nr:hypothetical protein [Raineya sp.]